MGRARAIPKARFRITQKRKTEESSGRGWGKPKDEKKKEGSDGPVRKGFTSYSCKQGK